MRPTQLFGFAFVLGLAACAADDGVPDELAGEDGDADGKNDGGGAFTYWRVDSVGDSFTATRANRTVTECGSGVKAETCEVGSLDLAGTALPGSVAKAFAARVLSGETLLLRGELGAEREELAFERLSRTAGPAIASADLVPVPSGGPEVHAGDENGPDCLYARLFVKDVDVETAEISITPTGGALAFHARFGNVSIPATTEFAVACVNGTSPVTVKATALTADGVLTVAADGTISITNTLYRFERMTFDAPTALPSPIPDLLDNEFALGNVVTSSVAVALKPLLAANKNGRALIASEVWQPGSSQAGELEGVFVLAKQDGDGIVERRLNSTRLASIDTVDLAASGADDATVERATAELAGDGVLLVGYRFIDGDVHGRAANQFWTKAPVPQQ